MSTPAIPGLPEGAILKPIQPQVEGLPEGAIVKPIAEANAQESSQAEQPSVLQRAGGWLKSEFENLPQALGSPSTQELATNPHALTDSSKKFTEAATMAVPGEAGIAGAKAVIPSAERAGQAFKDVMAAAKNVPVDTTAAESVAQEIKDFASRGGRLPKVIRDFAKRVDPTNPMTYEEARDFYSNARQLTMEEINSLKPQVKRKVIEFANTLGDSIQKAATSVGQGERYSQALNEYRQAKSLGEAIDTLKKWGIRGALTAAGGSAAYHLGKELGIF